jgi:hypothetical protein
MVSERSFTKEKELVDGESKTGHINCEAELRCRAKINGKADSTWGIQERPYRPEGTAGTSSRK